ncbi:MAG: hypothetical protein OIF56_02815 [Cohaesibacter sp.]|nr:hypothetical protein [Cohaesibacter sp.]
MAMKIHPDVLELDLKVLSLIPMSIRIRQGQETDILIMWKGQNKKYHADGGATDRIEAVKLANYFAWGYCARLPFRRSGRKGIVRSFGGGSGSRKVEAKSNRRSRAFSWPLVSMNLPDLRSCHLRCPTIFGHCRSHQNTEWHLVSMVREYLFLLSKDKSLRAEIRTVTMRMHPDLFKRLTPIIGVGETTAPHFLAQLFSPERFNRAEDVIPTARKIDPYDRILLAFW